MAPEARPRPQPDIRLKPTLRRQTSSVTKCWRPSELEHEKSSIYQTKQCDASSLHIPKRNRKGRTRAKQEKGTDKIQKYRSRGLKNCQRPSSDNGSAPARTNKSGTEKRPISEQTQCARRFDNSFGMYSASPVVNNFFA